MPGFCYEEEVNEDRQNPSREGNTMSLFQRNPLRKLRKQYEKKLVEMRDTQRAGDIQRLALLNEESEQLLQKIQSAEKQS